MFSSGTSPNRDSTVGLTHCSNICRTVQRSYMRRMCPSQFQRSSLAHRTMSIEDSRPSSRLVCRISWKAFLILSRSTYVVLFLSASRPRIRRGAWILHSYSRLRVSIPFVRLNPSRLTWCSSSARHISMPQCGWGGESVVQVLRKVSFNQILAILSRREPTVPLYTTFYLSDSILAWYGIQDLGSIFGCQATIPWSNVTIKCTWNHLGFMDHFPELPPESEEEEVVYEDLEIASSRRKRRRPPSARSEVMRLRREAMRKRKAEMETAWKDWKKPLLKPGDTVALIRPRDGRGCGQRILFVHRFWTEGEERGRQLFSVPGDIHLECLSEHASVVELCSRFDDFSTQLHREIVECKLWEAHTGARGSPKPVPIALESHILSIASCFSGTASK